MRPARPTDRRARLALPVAALLLVAGTGCAGDDGASDEAPSEATALDEPLTSGLELPLDAYQISPEDQAALEEARDSLIRECMARYGQEYAPADHPTPERDRHSYLYGVDDPELAAEHGYTHPSDLDPNAYAPPFEEPLTPDQETALHGDPDLGEDRPATLAEAEALTGPEVNGAPVPVTGCHGQAQLTLNDPDDDWIDPAVVYEIQNAAGHLADEDPRVEEVRADWSSCMADRGHDTASPLTAREDLGLEADVAGPEAVAAAVDDVACKAETDLVNRWAAVDAEYQREAIEEHAATLEELTEQHEERMARATRSP